MGDETYRVLILIISIFSVPTGLYYFLLLKDRWSSSSKRIIPHIPEPIKFGFRISILIFLFEIGFFLSYFLFEKMKNFSPWLSILVFNLCILFGLPFGFWVLSTLFKKISL